MDKLDQLLQSAAPKPVIRPELASRTLALAIQARRAHDTRRWLVGLLALSLVVLVAKWLKNDVLYLVSLLVQQPDLVRAKADLYLQATLESVPWAQIGVLAAFAALWVAWRQYETFLLASRKTGTKEGFIMKTIKFTPRLAAATLILGATALGFSGYTYAQVQEHQKLEILRQELNANGRYELEVNGEACAPNPFIPEQTTSFEITKNSKLSDSDMQQLVKAACNAASAEDVIRREFGADLSQPMVPAGHVVSFATSGLTLNIMQTEPMGKSQTPETSQLQLNVSSDFKVFDLEQGKIVDQSAIKPGMIVVPYAVSPDQQANSKLTAKALVIVPASPDLKWYDRTVWAHELTRTTNCAGNQKDRCHFGSSIDVYHGEQVPAHNPEAAKSIAGKVTAISANSVTLKSSSARTFTVRFTTDAVNQFNQDSSYHYGLKLETGDTVVVDYIEDPSRHSTALVSDQLASVRIALEPWVNSENPTKY